MNIAIVGATGLVGRTFLKMIELEQIKYDNLYLFASKRSAGQQVTFQKKTYTVIELNEENVKDKVIDFALYSAGSGVSKATAHFFTSIGAIVIDNSSAFRMDKHVPLIVPEVNMDDAGNALLIANPNCSTIQSVLPLEIVKQLSPIKRVDYTTFQAVSGSGQKGVNELKQSREGKDPIAYPYPIYNNVIAQIDRFLDDGFTFEEEKMIKETQKILHLPELEASATCVRVPVEHSHSVSMVVETETEIDLNELRKHYKNTEGIILKDEPENSVFPTPVEATDQGNVLVGRLRKDRYNSHIIHIFCSADNIIKGAALNAVQIMKKLIERSE